MALESWAGKIAKEIAAELDCPPKTVRVHLARFNAKADRGPGNASRIRPQATLDGARTQSDPAHLPTRGCALASYPQLGDQR
jgi:hypothetical protein